VTRCSILVRLVLGRMHLSEISLINSSKISTHKSKFSFFDKNKMNKLKGCGKPLNINLNWESNYDCSFKIFWLIYSKWKYVNIFIMLNEKKIVLDLWVMLINMIFYFYFYFCCVISLVIIYHLINKDRRIVISSINSLFGDMEGYY